MGRELYVNLWKKHRESIKKALKKAEEAPSIQLNGEEFKNVGNRKDYSFNLEFKNGKVSNTENGEAVSRDLRDVLKESGEVMEILKSGHFKIKMDPRFCLWISRKD